MIPLMKDDFSFNKMLTDKECLIKNCLFSILLFSFHTEWENRHLSPNLHVLSFFQAKHSLSLSLEELPAF